MVGKVFGVFVVVCLVVVNVMPVAIRGGVLDDVTAPVTSVVWDPVPNVHGWWNQPVTVSLVAVDNESGVNVTYFRLEGGQWEVYAGSFSVYEEGVTLLEYYSVDNAGNIEEVQQAEVRIDQTPPSTVVALDPPGPNGDNGWYISPVTVTAVASDALSGVNTTWCNGVYIGPFTIDTSGSFWISYYSMDNAGNVETQHHFLLQIDRDEPTIVLSEQVFLNRLKLTATVNDTTSGINRVDFYINDELRETITEPPYIYTYTWQAPPYTVTGITGKPGINDQNIFLFVLLGTIRMAHEDVYSFKADTYDNAGNWAEVNNITNPTGLVRTWVFFEGMWVSKNYTGFLGQHFVHATFQDIFIPPSNHEVTGDVLFRFTST